MKLSILSSVLIFLIVFVLIGTPIALHNREFVGGDVSYFPEGDFGTPTYMYFSTLKWGNFAIARNSDVGTVESSFYCRTFFNISMEGLDGWTYKTTWFQHVVWNTSPISIFDCERRMK